MLLAMLATRATRRAATSANSRCVQLESTFFAAHVRVSNFKHRLTST